MQGVPADGVERGLHQEARTQQCSSELKAELGDRVEGMRVVWGPPRLTPRSAS